MPQLGNHDNPFRTIISWTGTIASIPKGWIICDGSNGTPDLRSRFVRSVPDNTTNPGGVGGSDTHALTTAQMAVHSHSVIDPTHRHAFGDSGWVSGGANTATSSNTLVSPSVSNTGSGSAHENRPAYFQVLYIQKVSDNA